jgi:hypothetical protein
MEKTHCDGCGVTESKTVSKDHRTIYRVTFVIIEDKRFPEGAQKFEGDLCTDCQGHILHNYFGVSAEGKLDVPAFLEPVASRRVVQK